MSGGGIEPTTPRARRLGAQDRYVLELRQDFDAAWKAFAVPCSRWMAEACYGALIHTPAAHRRVRRLDEADSKGRQA